MNRYKYHIILVIIVSFVVLIINIIALTLNSMFYV